MRARLSLALGLALVIAPALGSAAPAATTPVPATPSSAAAVPPAGSPSAAAPPPAEVTADQAVALYRQRNPQLAAARAAIDVTRADLVQARLYPNPIVGLSSARTAGGTDTIGGSQHTLSLDIPLLIGHQRARREAAAAAHVDAARAELAADQGTAELEIRAHVAALLVAQERAAILAASLEDVRALREIVAGRARAGAGSPYAVERIDLAIATLASRVAEARAGERDASGELAAAVGIPGWHPRAAGDLRAAAAPPAAALDPAHPALAIDRAGEAAARADEARARAEAIPTPSLGLQALATTDPSGVALGAGLTIPLPLFDRNQGAVARARAEAHRAQLALAARASELTAELDRTASVLALRREALARFQADALQRLAGIRTMAETSYRSGQGGIVELLDAVDAITEARLRELELLAAVAEAERAVRAAAAGR